MACQLARLFSFLAPHRRSQPSNLDFDVPFKQDVTNEVSEYHGMLLVRLGAGSAMQVRLPPDGASVLVRTVPLAKATQREGDPTWQAASEAQLRSWIESNAAVWQWLVAKGLDGARLTAC
jgi:hypothetical protein